MFDSDRVIYIFCRRHWTKEAQRTLPVAQKLAEFMNINENSGTKDILFNCAYLLFYLFEFKIRNVLQFK